MDQMTFNYIVGIAGFLGGFILHAMWNSLRDLQIADKALVDRVAAIEVLVAGKYVPREEFDKTMAALFRKLDDIQTLQSEIKLDLGSKMSRGECTAIHHAP